MEAEDQQLHQDGPSVLRGHSPRELGMAQRKPGWWESARGWGGFREEVSIRGSCDLRLWPPPVPVVSSEPGERVGSGGTPRASLLPPQKGTCFQIRTRQFTECSEVPKQQAG